jgi:large subunit ribosomal protein L2
MPIRKFRPTSPGRRGASGFTFDEITKKEPEKSLLVTKKRVSGRGLGKISIRHRGGGAKRRIRVIDFKRDKLGVPGTVRAA